MTTWNPADKQTEVSLSAGNLTATYVPSGGNAGGSGGKVRGTDAGGTGKYFEVTINARALSGSAFSLAAGVANLSSPLVLSNDPTNSAMYFTDGWFLAPGTSANTGTSLAPGDIIGVYYKSDGSIEISKADSPRSIIVNWPTPPSGALYPCLWLQANNDAATVNFGATAFAFLPAGATGWNVTSGSLTPISASASQTLKRLTQIATASTTGGETAPPAFGTGGYFPDTIAAILAGRTVRCDFLVFMDFATTPMRVWQGFGTLHTTDGNDWRGIGQLGRIGDLESSIGGTNPQATFTLSGVDPNILASALNSDDEITNRDVNVYMQFFDSDLQPLDDPYVIWAGLMDKLTINQTADTCTVEMSAETIFANRARPPLGNLTDREQQQFFPGDTGLSGIPALMSKVAIWPVILPGYP